MNRLRIKYHVTKEKEPTTLREVFFSTIAILISLVFFFCGSRVLATGFEHENQFLGVVYCVLGVVVGLGLPLATIFLFFVLDLIHWE